MAFTDSTPASGLQSAASETVAQTTAGFQAVIDWFGDPGIWLVAGVAWALTFLALLAIRFGVMLGLRAAGARRESTWLHTIHTVVSRTSRLALALIALFAVTAASGLPEEFRAFTRILAIAAAILQGVVWVYHLVTSVLERIANTGQMDNGLRNAMSLIRTLLILVLAAIAVLMLLDNLGFDITTLIAGLGIGGIAVGLAAQGIVRDVFGSLSIVLDRPFVIGDFIVFGDMMGTVERVGLQTTRIRSLSGEQIVVANNDLLSSRIRNYKRMAERRVVFSVGVTYQTTPEQLERIPSIIRDAVGTQMMARFDRSHFKGYGDSALDFETVYYVLSADYAEYMDIQQAINMAVFRAFAEAGIDFAYPTRTLHIEQPVAAD